VAEPVRPRGRDDGLTVERLVSVTVELLDEAGIEAFSMRSLALRLGRSQMAAYRHVGGRDELLLRAALEVESVLPDLGDGPWYERLEAVMRHSWETTWSAHPWIVDLMHRGDFPLSASGRLELMQDLYRAGGFEGERLEDALVAHWSFVVGTLTVILAMRATGTAGDSRVFDFNLGLYLAGIRELAEEH
jgi:AcrR family transcriptional regulator